MNNKSLLLVVFSCFSLIILFSACQKLDDLDNLDVVNYDAEFAIPLFSGSSSFQDVLENFDEETFITILPDDLIQLNYKGNVTARTSEEIFNLVQDIPLLPLIDTVTAIGFEELPNNIDIDYAILNSGELSYKGLNQFNEPVTLTVTIPSLVKDGEVFTHTMTNLSIIFQSPTFDLSGYTLTPINDSIYIEYEAFLEDSGYADLLDGIGITIEGISASYIEGYLGNELYAIPRDTIEIEFFENWTRGDVYFEDPKILVRVENDFGFPVRSKANIMEVLTVDGEIKMLESDFIDEGIDFDYPSLDEVGETKVTNFYFDKDNSNITEILSSGPVAVDYDMDAISNPDSITSIRGFMTDTSAFKVQVEVELPIYGTAVGFEARDTFNFSLDEYNEVDYVEFKMIADNGIPVDVGMQAYFADAAGNILDSLFTPSQVILPAAGVDVQGEVTQREEKTTFTTLEETRFEQIRSAKHIYFSATFSTTNDGADLVKIYSDQDVQFRMGMKIGVKEE